INLLIIFYHKSVVRGRLSKKSNGGGKSPCTQSTSLVLPLACGSDSPLSIVQFQSYALPRSCTLKGGLSSRQKLQTLYKSDMHDLARGSFVAAIVIVSILLFIITI